MFQRLPIESVKRAARPVCNDHPFSHLPGAFEKRQPPGRHAARDAGISMAREGKYHGLFNARYSAPVEYSWGSKRRPAMARYDRMTPTIGSAPRVPA